MAKAKQGRPSAGKTPDPAAGEWAGFLDQVRTSVRQDKLERALKMLRAERFQLFAEVHPDHVVGVVRSQSTASRVYSCRLSSDGTYACCTQNLITCVVSRDSPCKHLLVLVLGLAKAGTLAPATALAWLKASRGHPAGSARDTSDKDAMAATFLRYKGVQAGEVDWRPTETIPEDFYAL